MVIVDAVDLGNAPEISVAGPCCVERISAGQIRVTYYSVYGRERRVVAHIVWDREAFTRTLELLPNLKQAVDAIPADSVMLLDVRAAH